MLEDEVVVEAEAFLEDVGGANLAGGLDLSGGHGEVALLEEGLGPAVRLAGVLGQVLAGGGVVGAGFAPGISLVMNLQGKMLTKKGPI